MPDGPGPDPLGAAPMMLGWEWPRKHLGKLVDRYSGTLADPDGV
jgi:hypothetical protein